MKYPIFIFTVVLFLALCSCQNAKTDSKPPENISTQKVEAGPRISASLIELPTPFAYKVRLEWANLEAPNTVTWALYRQSEKEGVKYLDTLPPQSREYIDPAVVSGTKYTYLLNKVEGPNQSTQEKVEIEIPQDISINERTTRILELKGKHRLFLGPKAHLVSLGQTVFIQVDEIISENALIESFEEVDPEGRLATAARGIPGRDGGLISIRALRGNGKLRVITRGENGGMGLEGIEGSQGKMGQDGKHAIVRLYQFDLLKHAANGFKARVENGRAFTHVTDFPFNAESIRFLQANTHLHHAIACIQQPTAAEDGGQGNPGGPGGNGARGGNSGRIYVEVKDASQFQVFPEQKAGIGGEPGPGGKGGRGGASGTSGSNFPYPFCNNSPSGKEGPVGNPGSSGFKGFDGNIETFCLRLGHATLGNCENFILTSEGKVI